jgi:hypothetical protein
MRSISVNQAKLGWYRTGHSLQVRHVVNLTGYKARTVRYLAQTGQLLGVKRGKKIWTFTREDVERFIEVEDEE